MFLLVMLTGRHIIKRAKRTRSVPSYSGYIIGDDVTMKVWGISVIREFDVSADDRNAKSKP